jgi:hypothetical protein
MRVAKSANGKLFKDFCDEAEMKKNIQIVGFILPSSPTVMIFNVMNVSCQLI